MAAMCLLGPPPTTAGIRRSVTAQLRDHEGTTVLRGLHFSRTDRAGTTELLVDDRQAWLDLLATTFQIDLSRASADAIDRMWERAEASARHAPEESRMSTRSEST
jgi:hypothetical protein